jgi:ABC-type branched-subunit amino acid transport system substrate-binding protein
MSKTTKLLLWIGIPLVVVIVILAIWKPWTEKEKEVIKIAFAGPLTGDNAIFGVPQLKAAELAVEQINKNGGILGKKLELVPFDDQADPKIATSIAQQIVSLGGFSVVVGHPNSGCAIPSSKIYNDGNILYIDTTATNPKLTQQGFKNVFRFAPTDAMQGISIANFIYEKLNKSELAIIHDNEAYGKGLADGVKNRFLEIGGKVVFEDSILAGDNDFRSLLKKIDEKGIRTVFYGGMLPEASKIVKQAKELGIDLVFIFGDGCYDEKIVELSGTDCKNVFITFLAPPWEDVESAKDFVNKYVEKYERVPAFAPYGYDAILVFAKAVELAGSLETDKLIEAMLSKEFKVEGVTGTITFNKNGQTEDKDFYVYTFNDNGEFTLFK